MISDITNRKVLVPALIGAGLCIFFIRSFFLSFFFLVPLGFLGYRYGSRVAWTAFLFAVIGNLIFNFGVLSLQGIREAGIQWDILYFSIMTCIFTWIVSPPQESARLTMSKRLIGGSCLGAVLVGIIFFRIASSPDFLRLIDTMLNNFIAMQRSSSADVVQSALLEAVTVEMVLEMVRAIIFRGGSLISCILLFSLCRQISFILARFAIRKSKEQIPGTSFPGASSLETSFLGASSLVAFHVNPSVIWALSASLLLVVLSRMINLVVPEIILWNVLILCVILYLAQGLGIVQFFLSRPSVPPVMALLVIVLFFIILLSPMLNLLLLGGLTVLGIVENWVPFRASKINGPPSTPEAS